LLFHPQSNERGVGPAVNGGGSGVGGMGGEEKREEGRQGGLIGHQNLLLV